ncbi:MAG TPA: polysaccharide deacetylase, partial [Terriglobales bacterium]|nr:polysaccharide deacetylase [Terriglobales bacterium]
MSEAIFYDPQRRRWKRLRRLFDAIAVATTLVVIFFVIMVFRQERLPNLLLPEQKRQYKALKEKERRRAKPRQATIRKKGKAPSQVVLNSGEGIRAAFYVTWDAASYSSLREYVHHIDLLYPEWLHVLQPDGSLQAFNSDNSRFQVIENGRVHPVDDPEKSVMRLIRDENAETEVYPLINNFDPLQGDHGEWMPQIGAVLENPEARQRMRSEVGAFLASDKFKGLTLDFEEVPEKAQPGYRALIDELSSDLHAHGLKLYVCVPTRNVD